MEQHILDDRVCTFAVLNDLAEIVPQGVDKFGYFSACLVVRLELTHGLLQLIDQLDRHPREVVDEIERIFDLVSDAGSQLTKRSQLLRLDETILRGPQILQRGLNVLE